MKLKSIVFTVALAAGISAFAGTAYLESVCFETNSTQTASIMTDGTFATEINAPIVITNSMSYTGGLTLDSYRITAYMTNLVVHATLPDAPDRFDGLYAKGAICAAEDGGHYKWYGLYYDSTKLDWAEITEGANYAEEGHSYVFITSFAASSGGVKYSVKNESGTVVAQTNDLLAAHASAALAPTRFAFAGTGAYTNLVAEFIFSFADSTAVVVDGGKIAVPDSAAAKYKDDSALETDSKNGLKNWVNYVLGIDTDTVVTKPYLASVQNGVANTLTFALGGVNVRAKTVTGATVEYTIEESDNRSSWGTAVDGTYESPDGEFNITAASDGVKYYRVLIRIDPVH